MRRHHPPTHLGYPAKKFLLLTGRQALVLLLGALLALAVADRTEAAPPLVRLIAAGVVVAGCAVLALADLPRRLSAALRYRRLAKHTVYRNAR